jgi:hypothetical protein
VRFNRAAAIETLLEELVERLMELQECDLAPARVSLLL